MKYPNEANQIITTLKRVFGVEVRTNGNSALCAYFPQTNHNLFIEFQGAYQLRLSWTGLVSQATAFIQDVGRPEYVSIRDNWPSQLVAAVAKLLEAFPADYAAALKRFEERERRHNAFQTHKAAVASTLQGWNVSQAPTEGPAADWTLDALPVVITSYKGVLYFHADELVIQNIEALPEVLRALEKLQGGTA